MDNFKIDLSLYDFIGYIIPGAIVTWAGQVLAVDVLRLERWPLKLADNTTTAAATFATVLFIVVSFVVGHFVQAVAKSCEQFILNPGYDAERVGRKVLYEKPQERALGQGDERYTASFKSQLRAKMGDIAGFAPTDKELLGLGCVALIQRDAAGKTEIFLAIFGLFRGLVVAMLFAAAVQLTLTVDSLSLHESVAARKQASTLAGVFVVGFLYAIVRARHFYGVYYDAVYRGVVTLKKA